MTNKQPDKQNLHPDLFSPSEGEPVAQPTEAAWPHADKPGGWLRPESVFVDLEFPQLKIGRALENFDHARVWSEYRRDKDQAAYLDWLASLAGSCSWSHPHACDHSRLTTSYIELYAVPYLLPSPGKQVPATSLERRGVWSMLQWLQAWMGHEQGVTALPESVPYAAICRWSPVTQREQLQVLARRRAPGAAPLLATGAMIPEGFPTLSFVVGGVKRWLAHPQLPAPGRGSHDWLMLSHLAAHLEYMHRLPVNANDVRLPAPFAPAVLEGLRMWIAEVARMQLARSWQVHVRQDDVVLLEIVCSDEETPAAIVPLRLHQIGIPGLELLMLDLQREIGPAVVTERASA